VGGASRGDYVQDERYIAMEHMAGIVPYNPLHFLRPWRSDVRRDRVTVAPGVKSIAAGRASHRPPTVLAPSIVLSLMNF